MSNTDFNTEGLDAKYGVRFKLSNGKTNTYWYATETRQKEEIKRWKSKVGKNQFYKSVKPVKR